MFLVATLVSRKRCVDDAGAFRKQKDLATRVNFLFVFLFGVFFCLSLPLEKNAVSLVFFS